LGPSGQQARLGAHGLNERRRLEAADTHGPDHGFLGHGSGARHPQGQAVCRTDARRECPLTHIHHRGVWPVLV